jgi:hypothetical protein
LCYDEYLEETGKMNSRLESLWYVIQHPLGPSRELGSYENHQEIVEKLIREMNARHPVVASLRDSEPLCDKPMPPS